MSDLNNPNYKPNHLLNTLLEKLGAKNDAALAEVLGVSHATISQVRNRRRTVGPGILLVMSEASHLAVGQLRQLMGLEPRMYMKG